MQTNALVEWVGASSPNSWLVSWIESILLEDIPVGEEQAESNSFGNTTQYGDNNGINWTLFSNNLGNKLSYH
jgi:hypothetical protein